MTKGKIIALLIIVTIFFLSGCSKKPAAVVNGEEISMDEFQIQLNQRLLSHKTTGVNINKKELRDAVINELIGRKLLLQVAKEKGIKVSEEELNKAIEAIKSSVGDEKLKKFLKDMNMTEQEYRKQTRDTLTIRKLISSLVPEDKITEDIMKEYYKNRAMPYIKPERVYVRLIQVTTEDEAKKIITELKKGMDFDKVAERLKAEKKAAVTDYGWAQPDTFSGEIKEALKKLKKGQYGGPYKGKEGYYILRVKDREPEKVMSYEEAKGQIKRELLAQQRQATVAHLIEERKKKANIEINIE
jgi:parvulin-like peptidyl-prolyl isomerase